MKVERNGRSKILKEIIFKEKSFEEDIVLNVILK
jgi:hypothetical protein